jgi:hypothetical protein
MTAATTERQSNGGKARAAKLSPERRSEIAKLGHDTRERSEAELRDRLQVARDVIAAIGLIAKSGYTPKQLEFLLRWRREDVTAWLRAAQRMVKGPSARGLLFDGAAMAERLEIAHLLIEAIALTAKSGYTPKQLEFLYGWRREDIVTWLRAGERMVAGRSRRGLLFGK